MTTNNYRSLESNSDHKVRFTYADKTQETVTITAINSKDALAKSERMASGTNTKVELV